MNAHAPVDHLSRASAAARAFVGRPHGLFIDGRFTDPTDARIAVVDPSTERTLAHVSEAGPAEVDRAVRAARRAFDEGPYPRMLPSEREALMLRLADLIDRDAAMLAELDALEMGKPVRLARQLVHSAARFIRYMAGWATKIHGRTITPSPRQPGLDLFAYAAPEPVGVAACIVPWNVALLMAAWKIGPALATGCTVVLKPAEETPLSALALADLVAEAGFPDGVVNIVTGRGEVTGQALVDHPGIDKLAFTGSTEVGKHVGRIAIGRMVRMTMELGGKSPVIILPDADVDAAIAGAANAIFYNSGQICGAGTRLLVHKSLHDRVVEGVARAAVAMRLGPAMDDATDLGPVASRKQYDAINAFLASAKEEGARSAAEPNPLPDAGFFVPPTVLADVTPGMRVATDEVFGPVLAVQRFATAEDAVRMANDTRYGLAAAVWGRDLSAVHRTVRGIRAGTVWVNTHHIYDPALPFGGFKESGMGREMGEDVLRNFLETKTVVMAV